MSVPILRAGDPAPWFVANSSVNPTFNFDTVGGYYSVICFFGDGHHAVGGPLLREMLAQQAWFSQRKIIFFAVGTQPADQILEAQVSDPVFCKFIRDHDGRVSTLYGALRADDHGQQNYRPVTYLINPLLQIMAVVSVTDTTQHVAQVMSLCNRFPPENLRNAAPVHAPVLRIPHVLSPKECQFLIDLHRQGDSRPSGFMREVDGRTVGVQDAYFKRRSDINLQDYPDILATINQRLLKRVVPFVERAFQFRITRFERYLIARYGAERQEFFLPHRDNTSKGTVHRRFAMSLNLNTGDYEGGYLRFPEFDNALYRATTGEAVIFSCSLLHEALPVTQGERFVLLSFFYNDDDARLREQNQHYIDKDSL